jgi:hypothetical protein
MSEALEVIFNNEEATEHLKQEVARSVEKLIQIDRIKSDLKAISAAVKAQYDLATGDFNSIVKHMYENGIEEELEYLSTIEFAINKLKPTEEPDDNNSDN